MPKTQRPTSSVQPITAVIVRGFKSLGGEVDHRVAFRPLTVLAGANSSGKSTAMQPLLLLKQTLESGFDPGALLLHDTHVRFTMADQILSRAQGQPPATRVRIGVEIDNATTAVSEFERGPRKSFELMATDYSRGSERVVLTADTLHDQITKITERPFEEVRQRLEKQLGKTLRWRPLRNRCFFGVALFEEQGGEMAFPFQPTLTTTEPYDHALRRIIHVPGLRGNPARTYQTTAVGEMFPGTFESYVATIVSDWQEHTPRLMQQLGSDLEALGLTWKVQAKQLNATEVELRVGRLPHPRQGGALDLVSIADVGFGVSQTLPVVVGLLAADEGRMVYLEQPEIHLHPRAQVGLANLLADAAARGVRVVVETHSALLLLALQSLVAEGRLPSESVLLHWFQRAEDGQTVVTSGELDKNGAYGEWPEDFGRVILNAESRYLDAMESQPS